MMEQLVACTTVITSSTLNEDVQRMEKKIDRNFVNLESHQLVWLASQHGHNSVSVETLRQIIDYTKLFEDADACEEYMKTSSEITTFLMISDGMNHEILSRIHNIKQVFRVYIHDTSSEENNNECLAKYPKVKLASKDVQLLLVTLTEDVKTFLKQNKSILISNNNLNSLPEQQVTHGDSLSWWSVFLDFLLYYLPYPKKDCLKKLVTAMKKYYTGNSAELRNVEEFENNYRMEDAIKWYTREMFVYRLVNKGFRQRNITLLILFGFYIQDIFSQLNDEHQKFKSTHLSSDLIKVYRGQSMWNEEIQDIKYGYNKIVNWCFFSTTRDRPLAFVYLNDFVKSEDPIQNVLFEIEIDYRTMSYPYADIAHLSYFPVESEILFMTGTAFHLIDTVYSEAEHLWLIKLKLEEDRRKTKENNSLSSTNSDTSKRSHLKTAVRTLLQRLDSIPTGDMNIIFDEIVALFPTEQNWLTAVRFHCLANHEQYRYGSILSTFKSRATNYYKALEIWRTYVNDIELNCHLDIADIHFEMAECHAHILVEEYKLAEIHYDLALENYILAQQSISIENNDKTCIYEKLDDIYQMKMKIANVNSNSDIFEMALKNRKDYVTHLIESNQPNDVTLASSYKNLAEMYKSVEKYDEALINYEKALGIYRSQTPSDYYTILCLAKEIADIYTRYKRDNSSAWQYQEIVRDIESKETSKLGHFMTAAKLHKTTTV
ncbi:unnamed protein product [Rotaria socialis]|uniref:Uncharacterized protein n=2 Tax=Rotaria socialis TaxID=392032 RepID=A0A817U453_9BILA|nr:unnamed protein product [Rotaria socialis]CAF3509162.1 unnamed protein product [Rotaria socialis]CAF3719102.1 unnamed protein product [Rotaria socialis]CAF4235221.1 unnamed protein product [Rotaria socialis]CAF4451797.1 unnamed protein product [Rotaria socialis]